MNASHLVNINIEHVARLSEEHNRSYSVSLLMRFCYIHHKNVFGIVILWNSYLSGDSISELEGEVEGGIAEYS